MDNDTRREIKSLWEKIGEVERKQSGFTDAKASEAKAISGNAWKPDTLYTDRDTVIYGDAFARCLHANKGIEPTNKIYWELVTVSDMILDLMERIEALEEEE